MTCSHIWHVDISKCMYWLDRHFVKICATKQKYRSFLWYVFQTYWTVLEIKNTYQSSKCNFGFKRALWWLISTLRNSIMTHPNTKLMIYTIRHYFPKDKSTLLIYSFIFSSSYFTVPYSSSFAFLSVIYPLFYDIQIKLITFMYAQV